MKYLLDTHTWLWWMREPRKLGTLTHQAIAEVWRSRGQVSSITACDSGTSAAPNTPCRRRAATISVSDCAAPQSADATVKPTMAIEKTRLRPKRAVQKPISGVQIA